MALIEVAFPLDSEAARREGMANLRRKKRKKKKKGSELLHTTDRSGKILYLLKIFTFSNVLFTLGEEEAF